MFVARDPAGRPMLAHLRRARYQDLLLVPGGAAAGARISISLRADGDPAELASRARSVRPAGGSAVEGPIDTPWSSAMRRAIVACASRVYGRGLGSLSSVPSSPTLCSYRITHLGYTDRVLEPIGLPDVLQRHIRCRSILSPTATRFDKGGNCGTSRFL